VRPPQKANARRQPSERVRLTNCIPSLARVARGIKLISAAGRASARTTSLWYAFAPGTSRTRLKDGETYGTPALCLWSVGPGVFRFQTNSPQIARKLAKRSKAQLVAWGVNCFLRIYQEPMSRRQAIRLVDRYLVTANGGFFELKRPLLRRNLQGGSLQREVANGRK